MKTYYTISSSVYDDRMIGAYTGTINAKKKPETKVIEGNTYQPDRYVDYFNSYDEAMEFLTKIKSYSK